MNIYLKLTQWRIGCLSMPLIGRQPELQLLSDLWDAKKAKLVVITGRRRIGKSTLIETFGSSYEFIKLQGLAPGKKVQARMQISNYSEQLTASTQLPRLNISNWTEAFKALDSQITNKKTVILLDEISWMAKGSPDFPGKLKIAWDDLFKKHPHLILCLCGSVSSWIDENILKNTDFVGRISLHIHLNELALNCVKGFWGQKNVSAIEKLRFLNIVGGVPRYLEELNPKQSSVLNIKKLSFYPGGFLVDEFEKIFNETFERRAQIYKKILRVLVDRRANFNTICKALKVQKNGSISNYLEDLILSGFIARDYIYSTEGMKSNLSVYRISDNYTRFYLKYLEPNIDRIKKSLLINADIEALKNWNQIMGFQFENLILNNTPLIIKELKLTPEEITSCSSYFQDKTSRTKGACQIDLLITTKFGNLYVCEIKFKSKIEIDVIASMRKKIEVLKRPRSTSIRPVLIYSGELDDSVRDADYFSNIINVANWLE